MRAAYNKTHWLDDRRAMMQAWAEELNVMAESPAAL